MTTSFKPLLAKDYDPALLRFPVLASPKIDGVRATVLNDQLVSRSLKPIPNKIVFKTLSNSALHGVDGELTVGVPTAHNVLRNTTSHVMSHDKEFEFTYHLFDTHAHPGTFKERYEHLKQYLPVARGLIRLSGFKANIELVPQRLITDLWMLEKYEAECLELGWEGIMIRDPNGSYKYGRSTAKEGILLKVKRFLDSEAEILEVVEEMENTNEKTMNELGKMKRSSHQAGKVGKGTCGSLFVRDLRSGQLFSIGSGIDDNLAAEIWKNRDFYIGRIIKYKYFPVGVKDLPRHPVFLGFRHKDDMSE